MTKVNIKRIVRENIPVKERTEFKDIARILEEKWTRYRKPVAYWDGTFKSNINNNNKVSICTTCMNRAEDLKLTYIKNIEDNLDYKNVEFVLLNYNSSDDLDSWVFSNLMRYIKSGVLNYYHTLEPKTYSMSHSRNVVFKLAKGDIVNNVDADCFTKTGFASYINSLANEIPSKAIFAKSYQLLRGRLGFYKKDFIEILGGYDEDMIEYGHEDQDLMFRAMEQDFIIMKFFGRNHEGIPKVKSPHHQNENYLEKRWWWTEGRNRLVSYTNLLVGKYKANEGKLWGKANVIHNFGERISI